MDNNANASERPSQRQRTSKDTHVTVSKLAEKPVANAENPVANPNNRKKYSYIKKSAMNARIADIASTYENAPTDPLNNQEGGRRKRKTHYKRKSHRRKSHKRK